MLCYAAAGLQKPPPPCFQIPAKKWNLKTEKVILFGKRKSVGRSRFVVRGGYKKIPMEAAGAYRLVDEESGEKFIVWGGSEEDEKANVPSKDVLTWKPKSGSARLNGDDEIGFGGQNGSGRRAAARVLDGGDEIGILMMF